MAASVSMRIASNDRSMGTDSDGLIDTSLESIRTYADQHSTMHGTKVQSFVDRGAAEAWLRSEMKSRKGVPSGTPHSQLKFSLKKRANLFDGSDAV